MSDDLRAAVGAMLDALGNNMGDDSARCPVCGRRMRWESWMTEIQLSPSEIVHQPDRCPVAKLQEMFK